MGTLLKIRYVSNIAWLHLLDVDKTRRLKARCELHEDAASSFEQIQESAR